MGPGSPRSPDGRRRVWSPARHRRLVRLLGETSSNGCHCPGFEGSCTACRSGHVPERGWHHFPGGARSPSGVPSGRKRASRNHLRLVGLRPRSSGSPARCRQAHKTGSVRDWKARGVGESKGRSFWRVPSLGRSRSLHLITIRNGVHSSTENVSFGLQTPQHSQAKPATRFRHARTGRCRQRWRSGSALVIAIPTHGDPPADVPPYHHPF